MIVAATLAQKVIISLATAGLVGVGSVIATNTRTLAQQGVRVQTLEKVSDKIDTLNDKLNAANVNMATLNANLENLRHERKSN